MKSNGLRSALTEVNADVNHIRDLCRQTLSWRWFRGKMIFVQSLFRAEAHLQYTRSLASSWVRIKKCEDTKLLVNRVKERLLSQALYSLIVRDSTGCTCFCVRTVLASTEVVVESSKLVHLLHLHKWTHLLSRESWDGWVWKGLLEIIWSNPLLKQGHLEQTAQDCVHMGFEYLQG